MTPPDVSCWGGGGDGESGGDSDGTADGGGGWCY